jgi:DNA helicase HerA-like ATPase
MSTGNRAGIFLGKGEKPEYLLVEFAHRHGVIAGAKGAGKTATLRLLAEGFSRAGVPVFAADVEGNLSGIAAPGGSKPFLLARAKDTGTADYVAEASPATFWDFYGEHGRLIPLSVDSLGPMVIARLAGLTKAEENQLAAAFQPSSPAKPPFVTPSDLHAQLDAMAPALRCRLAVFEEQVSGLSFETPIFDPAALVVRAGGRGVVNVLAAARLIEKPRVHALLHFWLLDRLSQTLSPVTNPAKPSFVFFFEEAHLLFQDAPLALIEHIQRIVHDLTAKGVGVFFVTPAPEAIPEQLIVEFPNRVQHAMQGFTARDQQAVATAAKPFRGKAGLEAERVILELEAGEALVSTPAKGGAPSIARIRLSPPRSRLGPLRPAELEALLPGTMRQTRSGALGRPSFFQRWFGGARRHGPGQRLG